MLLSRLFKSRWAGPIVTSALWVGLAATVAWSIASSDGASARGLSGTIALLTLFVAAITATFSLRYMRADARPTYFFLILGGLVTAVLTFLFAGDLLILALAWVASGWFLAALVGHFGEWEEARAAARRARRTFFIGDAAMLAGLGALAWHSGSLQIATVLADVPATDTPLITAAALLLVIAAAARCALPPFSGWLLSSMTAPTPVSALMHAGLVNAGGFLLLRFAPVLEAAPAARVIAIVAGMIAAIYGIGVMMVRPDVKRSLAGSTVSQMGFMIMSCGLGAYVAALWHIVAHGMFKAWLFLGSGSAIGTKAIRPDVKLSTTVSLAIAVATFSIALILLSRGSLDAGFVPLLLGLATAMTVTFATFGSDISARLKLSLLLVLGLLVLVHGTGLAVAREAVGPDARALLPEWSLLLLLAAFLGAWLWQQQRLSHGRSMPLRLYVHLMNAGGLGPAGTGEKK